MAAAARCARRPCSRCSRSGTRRCEQPGRRAGRGARGASSCAPTRWPGEVAARELRALPGDGARGGRARTARPTAGAGGRDRGPHGWAGVRLGATLRVAGRLDRADGRDLAAVLIARGPPGRAGRARARSCAGGPGPGRHPPAVAPSARRPRGAGAGAGRRRRRRPRRRGRRGLPHRRPDPPPRGERHEPDPDRRVPGGGRALVRRPGPGPGGRRAAGRGRVRAARPHRAERAARGGDGLGCPGRRWARTVAGADSVHSASRCLCCSWSRPVAGSVARVRAVGLRPRPGSWSSRRPGATPWCAGCPRWVAEAVAVPLAAQLACTPLVAALSGQVSLVAVGANMAVAWAVGPATVLGLLGGLGRARCGRPLGDAGGGTGGLVRGVDHRAWPGRDASLPARRWPGPPAGSRSRCSPRRAPSSRSSSATVLARRGLVLGLSGLLAVVMLVPVPDAGLAAAGLGAGGLRRRAGRRAGAQPRTARAVVVDAGPDPDLMDACLDRLGVRAVPLVVITHFHADHVDGLRGRAGRSAGRPGGDLAGRGSRAAACDWSARWHGRAGVPVRTVAYGETTRRRTAALAGPRPGPDVLPGLRLAAERRQRGLLVAVRGVRLLLMGDEERPSQADLRRTTTGLRADVLKVAHHGSSKQDLDLIRGARRPARGDLGGRRQRLRPPGAVHAAAARTTPGCRYAAPTSTATSQWSSTRTAGCGRRHGCRGGHRRRALSGAVRGCRHGNAGSVAGARPDHPGHRSGGVPRRARRAARCAPRCAGPTPRPS